MLGDPLLVFLVGMRTCSSECTCVQEKHPNHGPYFLVSKRRVKGSRRTCLFCSFSAGTFEGMGVAITHRSKHNYSKQASTARPTYKSATQRGIYTINHILSRVFRSYPSPSDLELQMCPIRSHGAQLQCSNSCKGKNNSERTLISSDKDMNCRSNVSLLSC